jgi:hypothetical protein
MLKALVKKSVGSQDTRKSRQQGEREGEGEFVGGSGGGGEDGEDTDDGRTIRTIVPLELERVEEEDRLARRRRREERREQPEEEQDERKRRRVLRTPEPVGLGMTHEDDKKLVDAQVHDRIPLSTGSSRCSRRFRVSSSQQFEQSGALQAQHAAAQSTIFALKELVQSQSQASSPPPPEPIPGSQQPHSVTQVPNDWKRSVQGQFVFRPQGMGERLASTREGW